MDQLPRQRLLLTVFDRRCTKSQHAAHHVQAPPSAVLREVVRRLGAQLPALRGIHGMLGADAEAWLCLSSSLAEMVEDGALFVDKVSGRVHCVAVFTTQPIFVHVPKTGGTTMIAALRGLSWQPSANDFHYRHIIYETCQPTCGDLFEPTPLNGARPFHSGLTVFTILREPLERMISEYGFLRGREHFMEKLRAPRPHCLLEYLRHPQSTNPMLRFLLGRPLFDYSPLPDDALERVLQVMGLRGGATAACDDARDGARWVVGLLERYGETVRLFEHCGAFRHVA
jgi:hypothetical protein